MRREHTWKSLALLLLLSVALVVAWHAVFDEKVRVVRSWDFARLQPEAWEWTFPSTRPLESSHGAAYIAHGSDWGPSIGGLGLDAREVDKVRVTARIVDIATGRELPLNLELAWARAEDISQPEGTWTPAPARTCPFQMLDHGDPQRATAQMAQWKEWASREWNGTVDAMRIRVRATPSSEQGYRVEISKIEFLKVVRRHGRAVHSDGEQ